MTVEVREEPFNDGREERSVSGRTIHVQTVYDVRELRLSDIAVELPGGRWRIIHHFLWQAEPVCEPPSASACGPPPGTASTAGGRRGR